MMYLPYLTGLTAKRLEITGYKASLVRNVSIDVLKLSLTEYIQVHCSHKMRKFETTTNHQMSFPLLFFQFVHLDSKSLCRLLPSGTKHWKKQLWQVR